MTAPLERRKWRGALLALAGASLAARGAGAQQRCDEPHYRWSVKIDTSLAGGPATPASIADILAGWAPPSLGRNDRCAPRAGRELGVFVVRGWIRRIETAKDDGDWHIELTAGRASPVDSCIVAEIPMSGLGATYREARAQLTGLLAGRRRDKQGDLSAPLEVRIVGAAFFDGQHRRTTRKQDRTDGGHGRCNTSLSALWEIHPVYAVLRP